MLLTFQMVQIFWTMVGSRATGPVTEGQVSEVEYICVHITAVKLKVRK